jgi:hypothetical protein
MNTNISAELARIRWHLAALRFQNSMLRHAQALRKYDPKQPRVPAGDPDGGQWTSGFGGVGVSIFEDPADHFPAGEILSDAAPDPLREGEQYAQAQVTIDYSRALTGLSTIDTATRGLSQTLARTMEAVDFIPEWTPQIYGTAVHVAFGASVRLQGLSGIGPNDVEQSFFGEGKPGSYGQPGSVRTDVVLRNQSGDIIAIYDVKTGGARLTAARVRELRLRTGVGPNVPIIELHVLRGVSLKGRSRQRSLIRLVIAQLWNPLRQDNLDLAGGE